MADFSVLMSLYYKEDPAHLTACMESLLCQTALPEQIVIVKDGALTPELEAVLEGFISRSPQLYTVVTLPENQGLGLALAAGIPACRNELIARMDTDDICHRERFALQLAEFDQNPHLDVCGSHIAEFEGDVTNIVARRTVPLTDSAIKQYQKRRDGVNHMTVMYKKSKVLEAGNYQSCPLMEDTFLWVRMILCGATFKNIDRELVCARVGGAMFSRRGGLAYFKKYRAGRKQVYATGYISRWDYFSTLAVQLAVCLMPNRLRGWVFKKLLHR